MLASTDISSAVIILVASGVEKSRNVVYLISAERRNEVLVLT